MTEPILLVTCVLLVAAVGGLALALVRLRSRTARDLAALQAQVAGLSASPGGLDTASPSGSAGSTSEDRTTGESDYVITSLGTVEPDRVEPVDGRLFADLVLRETVVRTAGLVHGVRRGLAAETRNRIRFEMRREVRRARKQRRQDLKQAQREWKARQRALIAEDDAA